MSTAEQVEVFYPESDGQPLGETGIHVLATLQLFAWMEEHFRLRADVHVNCDIFLYYEEGNPRAVRAPDVMVTFGMDKAPRRTYKTWVENAAPSIVFEVTSDSTVDEDLGPKKDLYARLGVSEYYLFDPLGVDLDPRFQAFRLAGGRYERAEVDADGGIDSPLLGTRLFVDDVFLKVVDPRRNAPYYRFNEFGETVDALSVVNDDLADANRDLTDANRGLVDVNRDLTDANRGLTDVNRDLTDVNRDLTDVNRDLTDVNRDLTDANRDLGDRLSAEAGARREAEAEVERLRRLLGEVRGGATDREGGPR